MATENPTWGYTRIRGGLKCLGHEVARNTIKAILKDHGIEPAPERGAKISWKTFLTAHWEGLAAADFFTVEVLTLRGLVRYVVFFVMRLKTRTVEVAGITSEPMCRPALFICGPQGIDLCRAARFRRSFAER
jgi:hypothetical protein